ncbi:MAG: hypothetical protein IH607_08535, partial [Firmicutes bacterium]|nr:hypothetical protein [Bacillota bacterium]
HAATFERKVETAQRIKRFQELVNDENAQVYVLNTNHGRGVQIVYVVSSDQTSPDEGTADTVTQDTTQPAAEDSVSN